MQRVHAQGRNPCAARCTTRMVMVAPSPPGAPWSQQQYGCLMRPHAGATKPERAVGRAVAFAVALPTRPMPAAAATHDHLAEKTNHVTLSEDYDLHQGIPATSQQPNCLLNLFLYRRSFSIILSTAKSSFTLTPVGS